MTSKIASDPRLDPRIRNLMGAMDMPNPGDAESREQLLEEASSETAVATREATRMFMEACDNEEVAPSAGLRIETLSFTSDPDGNTIQVQFIRPDNDEVLPAVCYLHGGGMQAMSCFDGMYRAWGRIIAAQGVAVAMVDFRNCLVASSAPEVEPFPAGLNDCVSGVKWLHANAGSLGVDTDHCHRAQAQAGRRPRAHPRSLRSVPLHRRTLAPGTVSIVHGEQRHSDRAAQQPGQPVTATRPPGRSHRGLRSGAGHRA